MTWIDAAIGGTGGGVLATALTWVLSRSRRARELAAAIRTDEIVNEAVSDVALKAIADSGKYIPGGELHLIHEQTRNELASVKAIVQSSDKKLNALIAAARITIRRTDNINSDQEE